MCVCVKLGMNRVFLKACTLVSEYQGNRNHLCTLLICDLRNCAKANAKRGPHPIRACPLHVSANKEGVLRYHCDYALFVVSAVFKSVAATCS